MNIPEPLRSVAAAFVILAPAAGGVAFSIGVMVRAFREFKEALTVVEGIVGLKSAFLGVGKAAEEGAEGVASKAGAMASAVEGAEAKIGASASNISKALGGISAGRLLSIAGEIGLFVDNIATAAKGAAVVADQLSDMRDQGHGAKDVGYGLGAMLPSWAGGDYFKGKLTESMQGEKDRGELAEPAQEEAPTGKAKAKRKKAKGRTSVGPLTRVRGRQASARLRPATRCRTSAPRSSPRRSTRTPSRS